MACMATLAHVLLLPSAHHLYPAITAMTMAAVTAVYVAMTFERYRVGRSIAEANLRESEARKGSILDAALDCIVTIDHEGRIVEFNPAAEQTFGFARAAVLGRQMAELLIPVTRRASHVRGFARYLATGDGRVLGKRMETTAIRADGSEFPVELAVVVIGRQGPPLFTAYLRDLTERRLAEEAQVSAALVRVGHEMTQLLDTRLILERLAGVVADLLGADHTVTVLRQREEHGFFVTADGGRLARQVRWDALRPLLERLDEDRLIELAGTAPAELPGDVASLVGSAPTALLLALSGGDEIVGVHIAAYADRQGPFTVQERRLARGIAQIASMALTNARLVEELAHANRVKSEFVSTMSHELRTPLHVVMGYAEMARDQELPLSEREELLVGIERAGRELLDLVEDTLDVGRLEAGQSAVRFEAVGLRTFWAGMWANCAELRRRADVALVWGHEVPDVMVVTDPRKLRAVVGNLVSNACKFTERGRVEACVALCDDRLQLSVTDTGIGIRPEDRNVIFEMFRQADGSETRKFGGTGVGLYIVSRFVGQLGGTVTVESTPGEGSTFTVTLPLDAAAPVSRAA
jgi:PAS domain S-box-containing protein